MLNVKIPIVLLTGDLQSHEGVVHFAGLHCAQLAGKLNHHWSINYHWLFDSIDSSSCFSFSIKSQYLWDSLEKFQCGIKWKHDLVNLIPNSPCVSTIPCILHWIQTRFSNTNLIKSGFFLRIPFSLNCNFRQTIVHSTRCDWLPYITGHWFHFLCRRPRGSYWKGSIFVRICWTK